MTLVNSIHKVFIILFALVFTVSCTSGVGTNESIEDNSIEANVEVTHDGDPQLYDIWNVTHIFLEDIGEVESRPRMELNLATLEVMGDNGCNHFQGKITRYSDNRINFGNVANTNKMCHEMKIPDAFNAALNQVEFYNRDDLILYFYDNNGDEVLQFRKGD